MRRWVALSLIILTPSLEASRPLVEMGSEQINHLDVQLTQPQAVNNIPLTEAPGRVVLPPAQEFAVTSRQPGMISKVNVSIGVKVRQGEVLAEMDSIALVDLQRALIDAQSVFRVAESKLKRDDTLLQEGVISKVRWQETHSDFERSQATLKAAEQTLLVSGLTLGDIQRLKAGAQINGAYRVLSPTSGVVLERFAIVGQRVDALAPLFKIGRLDELWLEMDLPQERLKEIRLGDGVELESPRAKARIIEISANVNPLSQTALVRARVEEGQGDLLPGMHINVQLMHRSSDRIFRIPLSALFSHEGRQYVFVRREGGFEPVEVAVAGQEAYSVVLHEGLEGGESIVVQGVAALKAAWLGQATAGHSD